MTQNKIQLRFCFYMNAGSLLCFLICWIYYSWLNKRIDKEIFIT